MPQTDSMAAETAADWRHDGSVERIAGQVVGYRQWGRRLGPSDPRFNVVSEAQAEAIQDLVAARIDEPVHGWKLGAIEASGRTRLGLSKPFIGRVFASRLGISPALISPLLLPWCVVESEIAFRFGKALPVRRGSYSRTEVIDAVDALVPAYEVVDFSWPTRDGMSGIDIVADNGGCGGMVVGAPVLNWLDIDLLQETVGLRIDDQLVAEGRVGRSVTDSITVLEWFANHLNERGIGVEAAQYVTTGTWTGMHRLHAGQTAVANFSSIGSVKATMAAG